MRRKVMSDMRWASTKMMLSASADPTFLRGSPVSVYISNPASGRRYESVLKREVGGIRRCDIGMLVATCEMLWVRSLGEVACDSRRMPRLLVHTHNCLGRKE